MHKGIYRRAHEKPARRLVDQRGRRSRTLYRELNNCKCKVLTGWRMCWKWSSCTSMHFGARCSILSYTRCNSAVSILRIDTAELHRVHDNMLQRAPKCIDVQEDHFQHILQPVSNLHLHLFNSLYRVRDLRPRWSTRRRAGFSCATLQLSGVNSPNWHRWVASRVWQYAAAFTKVHWRTRISFSAHSLTSKYFVFAFV